MAICVIPKQYKGCNSISLKSQYLRDSNCFSWNDHDCSATFGVLLVWGNRSRVIPNQARRRKLKSQTHTRPYLGL